MWYLFTVALLTVCVVRPERRANSGRRNLSKSARIKCRGASLKKYSLAHNIKSCRSVAAEFPDYSLCPEGCVGLYSCLRACPVGALEGKLKVDGSLCISCGSCAGVCPKDLIEFKNKQKAPVVFCSFALKPERREDICRKGCRKCYGCLDICPQGAIHVNEKGIPATDISKCRLCLRCVRKCPSGARRTINA